MTIATELRGVMSKIISGIISTTLLLWGCSAGPAAPSTQPPDFAAAPTSVTLAGKRLTLSTSLWRDFMPISPPDGKPLVGLLRVQTEDGSLVPVDVRADAAWVVHGAEVWSAAPREERSRSETAPIYELVVRDGPKWGPNVAVDVVVRLVDGRDRRELVSARNQRIGGTF